MPYRAVSLWHATAGDSWVPRPPLPGDRDADVAVVGAGFTGLWTAYYLLKAEPGLRVVVLEQETAGFGASGRNGGWASALFPVSLSRLARLPGSGPSQALRMHRLLVGSVDEIGAVVAAEQIHCGFCKGGTVAVARSRAQLHRAREEVAAARAWGRGEDDLRLLDATEVSRLVAITGALGGTFTPHCARIHPARLVRGLARAVVRLGGRVYEQTPVSRIEPGRAVSPRGTVRAQHVIRATEGYTPALTGHHRALVPLYSLMIATEPLPDRVWDEIGLATLPTFTDGRHLLVYGQRTVDDRIAFGGRGAPYHFRSTVSPGFDHDARVFARLREALVDLFPVLRGTAVTHAWGGPLGAARDWCASVGLDDRTGFAWAGGYVGDGVGTSNLAGRTLRDLILRRDTELVRLPWVQHRSRRWEPEPLRWLGINAGLQAMALADREERLTGRPSLLARATGRLLGNG